MQLLKQTFLQAIFNYFLRQKSIEMVSVLDKLNKIQLSEDIFEFSEDIESKEKI